MTTAESKSDTEISKSKSFKDVETLRSPDEHQKSFVLNDVVFDATEDIHHYKPIDTFEGIHRWDPDFEWEEEEEKRIVRKVTTKSTCCGNNRKLIDNVYR
jgi:MFS transporter, ACS family, DAL5 transporter family protein